jgi:hypothetical protein
MAMLWFRPGAAARRRAVCRGAVAPVGIFTANAASAPVTWS